MDVIGPHGRWQDVEVAATFRSRLRGVIGRPSRLAILRTRTVHGFGLREPLWAVGITDDGVVAAVRRLRPGRVVWLGGARWILEVPATMAPPRRGDRLTLARRGSEPGRHGRPSLPMRHPDRESR